VVAPLSRLVRFLAKGFISVHWAQQALERLLPDADLAFLGRQRDGFLAPWAIVFAQAAAGAVATVLVLWQTKGDSRVEMSLIRPLVPYTAKIYHP
jgi:hypothetical protein